MSEGVAPRGPQAQDLSPEEREERGRKCYALDQSIRATLKVGREALWATAASAYAFDEEAGWGALGYDALGDWLADPDIGMTRSTYYRLVGSYRELVVVRKVPELEVSTLEMSKVDIVLPAVKAGRKSLKEALADARSLAWRDLREAYLGRPDTPAAGASDDPPPAPSEPEVETVTGTASISVTDPDPPEDDEEEDVVDAVVIRDADDPPEDGDPPEPETLVVPGLALALEDARSALAVPLASPDSKRELRKALVGLVAVLEDVE